MYVEVGFVKECGSRCMGMCVDVCGGGGVCRRVLVCLRVEEIKRNVSKEMNLLGLKRVNKVEYTA